MLKYAGLSHARIASSFQQCLIRADDKSCDGRHKGDVEAGAIQRFIELQNNLRGLSSEILILAY